MNNPNRNWLIIQRTHWWLPDGKGVEGKEKKEEEINEYRLVGTE